MLLASENHSTYSNVSTSSYELGRALRFWLFFGFDVSSIVCSILVLYYLLMERALRQALHNHVSILMLLFNFVYQMIDIPLHLQYLHTGIVRPATPTLCLIWWFIDWGFFFNDEILLLWAMIERHILIFHNELIATRRRRLLIHYFPISMIVLLVMMFYIVAIFAPSCQNTFDYTMDLCGMYACYESVQFFATVEQLGFGTIGMSLIAMFSIALLVRVIWQKYQIHRHIRWQQQWKITVNLVCISLLYLCSCFPLGIINLIWLYAQPNFANEIVPTYFFVSYFPIFLLPFVCLGTVPKLWNKVKKHDPRQRRRIMAIISQS